MLGAPIAVAIIDGDQQYPFQTTPGCGYLVSVDGLAAGEHTLDIEFTLKRGDAIYAMFP